MISAGHHGEREADDAVLRAGRESVLPGMWSSAALVLAVGVWAYGLLDFMKTDEREMRTFSRPVWLVILVFGIALGTIAWMVAGRPQRPLPR
jgi:hypothetical protein